ncbi:MAG: DUF5655 domain-containing protein [Patescibacteria group bacterium]|nr:DUF5655 domain-containing protein [Patescibacteria group bacterium]MDD5716142.1 DUF5655 domain-containing protein [Patescibacteria group bacterium]
MTTIWTCPKCHRTFDRENRPHSCVIYPVENHFRNKEEAEKLFAQLKKAITQKIGPVKVYALPCCIRVHHIRDFMAVLPKRNGVLELRLGHSHPIKSKRIFASVPMSKTTFKNCLRISSAKDIDTELLGWVRESYKLRP